MARVHNALDRAQQTLLLEYYTSDAGRKTLDGMDIPSVAKKSAEVLGFPVTTGNVKGARDTAYKLGREIWATGRTRGSGLTMRVAELERRLGRLELEWLGKQDTD